MARETGPGRQGGGALLLGRRSYEGMLQAWNQRGGPRLSLIKSVTTTTGVIIATYRA